MTRKTNHLESLEKALEKKEHKEQKEAEREKEEKTKKREWDARKKEEKYSKEKTVLADYIFSWAKEFVQTLPYLSITSVNPYLASQIGIHIFSTSRADGWPDLDLLPNGTFGYYSASYKPGLTGQYILIKTLDELKDTLCYEDLKKFARRIKNKQFGRYR